MWRNLLMGLLLANLLLLAWGRWVVAPDVVDPRAFGDATGPQLVLVERPTRLDSELVTAGDRCFRLGPFESADAAAVVSGRLSARGLAVERARESGQIWVGHWVKLLDLPGDEAARQAVIRLVSVGIGDAYVSAREPTVDISLGVFRGRRGADNVIRLARAAGYAAVMTDRFRAGVEHWVEVETPAARPPDLDDLGLVDASSGQAQIVRIEEQPCASAAAVMDGDDLNDSLESRARENGSSEPLVLPE